jgi:C-terminal processing protease CtpA/Prc
MMKSYAPFRIALVLAAGLSSLFAGESGKKCTYSTQECLNHMAEKMKASGWIGIEYDLDKATGTSKILRVIPGSPAEKAGLQVDDVLFALDGVEITEKNYETLAKARKDWKPGRTVTYTIVRGGSKLQVSVVLGEWPADLLARYIGEHMLEHAESDKVAARPAPPK